MFMFSNTKKEMAQEALSISNNIIGKGTNLEGHLKTAGNLRIEGKVSGSIQTNTKAVLGETSVVEGDITAQTAEIGGEVHGTIKVSGLLILKTTAVVSGDIVTSKLVFEEGAKFNGKCNMGHPPKETKVTQPQIASHQRSSDSIEAVLQQTTRSQQEKQSAS